MMLQLLRDKLLKILQQETVFSPIVVVVPHIYEYLLLLGI